MTSFVGLILLLAIVAFLSLAFQKATSGREKNRVQKISPSWEPPKADPLPYAKRKFFFSAAELFFYEVLRRLVPEYTVFAKVRLVDLVRVTRESSSWQSDLNRIDRKHLDFVLCDANLTPVLAIELDDASHDRSERSERDEFVDQVLAAAKLPIVHVHALRGYQLDQVRQSIAPHVSISVRTPAEVADLNPSRYTPPAGWRPAT